MDLTWSLKGSYQEHPASCPFGGGKPNSVPGLVSGMAALSAWYATLLSLPSLPLVPEEDRTRT